MNGEGVIAPNLWVAYAFGNPWTGFILAMSILALAGGIVLYNYLRRYRPISRNLEARLRATAIVDQADDDGHAQQAFADNFAAIEAAMLSGGRQAIELRHAWIEFTETFVDKDAPLLQATTRPEGYFLHLGDDTRVLAFWANIFVAVGLTFTFLGIIAALVNAVQAIGGGADMRAMQAALVQLLTVTAAKFWTSIGGVIASILLRWVDRTWHSRIQRGLEQLSDRIERGTVFYPPQRFAAEQLRELKQQSIAMTEFSTQLAASIGDALERNMAPVVQGLGGLQDALGSHLAPLTDIRTSIDEFKSGSLNDFGSKLGDAIKDNAGSEMRGLADALTRMTTDLGSVNDRLEGASGEASQQIASAAREFSTASEAMTRAFDQLNGNIDAMANRLAEQGEEADRRVRERVAEDRASYDAMATGQREVMRAMGEEMRSASAASAAEMVRAVKDAVRDSMGESQTAIRSALDGFSGATAGIQTAFDQMRGQVAELGQALTGSASDAADRNADVLARAAAALEGAAAQAQAGMGASLDAAIARSAEASSAAISKAFAAFGERFEAASAGLVSTLTATAERMETLASAIERSTGAADEHAGKLSAAGREAQAVSTMLGRAANDLHGAAEPIRRATDSIDKAATWTNDALKEMERRTRLQQDVMQGIADSLDRTSSSATLAWDNHRTRFAEVDQSLGRALEQIRAASAEHATALNTQVGRVDSALATAVERLAGALDDIKDLADALEDVRGRYQQAAE